MGKTVEIVLYQHGGMWHWRIDVDGKTDEDSKNGYVNAVDCLAYAQAVYNARFGLLVRQANKAKKIGA